MKQLTLKALFISAIAAFSLNVHASSNYDLCIADGQNVLNTGKSEGSTAAEAIEQKMTIAQCFTELDKIEAKYGDKTKGLNPSSVMTPEDKLAWSNLFDAIDYKQFRGTAYMMAVYYR